MEKTTQLILLLLYSSFLTEGLRVRKRVEIKRNTSSSDLSSENETRGARFLNMLSLFTLVSFDNNDCTTSSGTQGRYRISHLQITSILVVQKGAQIVELVRLFEC